MDLTVTSAKFEHIYRSLVLSDVKRQLAPLFTPEGISENDIAYALSTASRLSLVGLESNLEDAVAVRKAYDVATRSLFFGNGAGRVFREASELILGRLGNFPARRLLNQRFETTLTALSALEILGREFENRSQQNLTLVLTDFQVRLLRALETKKYVSVSAPTSAGKSFTLELEISRQLQNKSKFHAVYLVPTRALIRQVTFDLVQLVKGKGFKGVPILSVPAPPDKSQLQLIYVLTQERFANLLKIAGNDLALDALIVDEAQEISEQNRGQTLEAVIADAIIRNPGAKVFFSCPLKSNPEFLLTLCTGEQDKEAFIEHVAPVSQNIINIVPVKGTGNTSKAKFEVWLEGESISLGMADLRFKFRNNNYMHNFAAILTAENDTSIIYCNEPRRADKVADSLAGLLPDAQDEPAISDLISFLKEHIHPQYRLARVLEKRVAFHYGNIPQIIRARIEDLLKEQAIRFVCCTSTLLQGMNLPAKNIFVENPKKGRGRPMSAGDFWNLVGRAGRMAREFDGNIYCIHGVEWESEPLKAARLDSVKSAFMVALTDGVSEVADAAVTLPDSSESDLNWTEQTIARIFADFTSKGLRVSDSRIANPVNRSALNALDETLHIVKSQQTLPSVIYEQNLYFHPMRLEKLASRFRDGDSTQWIPPNPYAKGSYDQLKFCFGLLEEIFFQTGFETYRYDAFLALNWMQGKSLKELIANKIEYNHAGNDVDRINDLIRDLFSEIENTLRYKYVKYMTVYSDVLKAILLEKGQQLDAERIPPIHLFLEYGAANLTLINLMSIGLSRTSAILLKHSRGMGDNLLPNECQSLIEQIDLGSSSLPGLCKSEIGRLRRQD